MYIFLFCFVLFCFVFVFFHSSQRTTSHPTPNPTSNSTPRQTPRLTLDFSMDVAIVVSNGCYLTDRECASMTEYLCDFVEILNPEFVTVTIYTHNLSPGMVTLIGDRESLLDQIDDLACEVALTAVYNDLASYSADEQKIVIISLCGKDSGDKTCDVPSIQDSSGDGEIIFVNAGDDVAVLD